MKATMGVLFLRFTNRSLLGIFVLLLVVFCSIDATYAQEQKVVTGKITDARSGEAIPYATIYVKIKGTVKAAASDFDGLYRLILPQGTAVDSIYATYVSYATAKKILPKAAEAVVDFQLAASSKMLNTVTITPKTYINPAWEILENLVKNKPVNDQKRLKSYGYQSYTVLILR